ncbi:MAG: hypothetical protein JRI68_20205, partial [Deltaproteobacteria bacterium]|nr:hypothetical protein [Deltaproteobacteria bacterium]
MLRHPHKLLRGVPFRVAALAAVVSLAPSCEHGIDTTRDAPRKATLGDDIYTLMCDRLGASSFTEDLTGASFHSICHFDGDGNYGHSVDVSVLPEPDGEAAVVARQRSVAKLERMAARRQVLIRAFNTAFPDIDIPDVTTANPDDTIRLHDALLRFSQDITELYEDNPFDSGSSPTMPMATDSIGRLFEALEQDEEGRAALARIAGRQGYRPFTVGLGAIRTLLAYLEMRPLVVTQMEVLGPNGTAVPELQQMLGVVKRELRTAQPTLSGQPPYTVNPATAQPNRARSALEVTAALMLDQDDAYAASPDEIPRYISRRDMRGFIVPAGNQPGVVGSVPFPFSDMNGDGYADVDWLGQFIDDQGYPLVLETPFVIPGQPSNTVDPFGRTDPNLYSYLDTSRTMVGAMARDLVPLLDPTAYVGPDDPEPWKSEHEAVMYALAGVHLLAGPREPAQFDHLAEAIVAPGEPCPISGSSVACTQYQRFVAEQSPLPDLVHAAGQLLAHPDSDAILLGLMELVGNHEQTVARLMGASLRVKAIADEHDVLADQGLEERAEVPYETPIYDEMAQVLHEMAQHPGLIAKLLSALADPVVVSTHWQNSLITGPPATHFGETLSAYMAMRDKYVYNPQNINGPAVNLTDGGTGFANPHNPVDRSQPLNGDNRSMWERSAQLIYDGHESTTCNKEGGKVYTGTGDLYWPLIGSYTECELFTFDNTAAFYLNSQLPSNHPKRAELVIKSGVLQALLDFIGGFTSQDAFLESASGLTGMTLHPSATALNRLLFYGAHSDQFGQMSDHDFVNAGTDTDKFVTNITEPTAGVTCPKNNNGVNHCSSVNDVLRMRDRGTIFGWERLGFFDYLRPTVQVFAEVGCNEAVTQCNPTDYTGESFYLDLVSILSRHWPGYDHGPNCDSDTSPSDPRYCSGAGLNRYEPLLADAFLSDLIPAMHQFAKEAVAVNITIQRGPKAGQVINGTEIVELLVKVLFDQSYAASVGMTDRFGNGSTTWVDGTPQAQVTPYSLFADALHKMDATFDQSADPTAQERKAKWKRARSLLVDQFLRVNGTGGTAEFANKGTSSTLVAVLRVLREQLNFHCPSREQGGGCTWATVDLGRKVNDVFSRPVFAAMADLTDKINSHEPARRELERFLSY